MKITKNNRTVFLIPTGTIASRCTAGMIARKLNKEGIMLTSEQVLSIIDEIKRYKKNHKDWRLIDVKRENGDTASIEI